MAKNRPAICTSKTVKVKINDGLKWFANVRNSVCRTRQFATSFSMYDAQSYCTSEPSGHSMVYR